MPQEILKQLSFNVGEIDPRVDARSDVKIYYAGLELAENVVTTPVGPLIRRPGTEFIDYARHHLDAVPLVAANVVPLAGATPAHIVAADGTLYTTTTPMGAADMVLIQVDFGHEVEVHLIDLLDFAAKDTAMGAPDPEPPPFTYPFPNGNYTPPVDGIFPNQQIP